MASPLQRFVVLYAAMYAAYGVASPFLPAFVHSRGIPSAELGIVLGSATAIKLLAAPAAGRLGDRLHALRIVLASCMLAAAAATLGYLGAKGFWAFFSLALLQAAALAPMGVLADALALENAKPRDPRGFEYGWVRGAGSAAFIAGTLVSGQVIAALGLGSIVWMQSALLCVAAFAALRAPEAASRRNCSREPRDGLALLRIATFRNVVIAAALVLGSHAMHDAFAMIRWREAGVAPGTASLLWSEAVAAEVLVFFLAGPALLKRISPAAAIALAAAAGVVRWLAMGQTAQVAVLVLVQPLHGFTFALFHLACMRLIARAVPSGFEGTGQAIYATLGAGGASALLTLASGKLYALFGAHAFWAMAALCLAALPVAWNLRRSGAEPARASAL